MSDNTAGKVKPKTLILGGASGLAALALAILAGWLIMKRVGEPQTASLPQNNSATESSSQMPATAPAETQAKAQPDVAPAIEDGSDASKVATLMTAEPAVPAAPTADAKPAAQPVAPTAATPDGSLQPDDDTKIEMARVEPSGDAVFAGTTGPGAKIELYAGDRKIGESSSDAQGNWAVVLDKQLPSGSSDIYAVVTDKTGNMTRSIDSIAVVIDEAKKAQPLIVAQSDAGSRVIQNPASNATAGAESAAAPAQAPETQVAAVSQAAETASASPQAAAPAAETAAAPPSTAATAPAGAEPPATQTLVTTAPATSDAPAAAATVAVSIEAADYDTTGKLAVSGRSAPGTTIRLYYDNEHVGDALAGADGFWALSVDRQLDGGIHALRADALAPGDAQVAGRAEVSFIAAVPNTQEQKLAAAQPVPATPQAPVATAPATETAGTVPGEPSADQPSVAATSAPAQTTPSAEAANPNRITVARGDNLWRLARDLYGRGVRYTTIYDANRDQIRDPDLIFPGQVFLLPRASDADKSSVN